MIVAVAGATGNVGSELVAILAEQGEQVRGLVRDSNASLPTSVEQFVVDMNDGASFRDALAGAEAVFLMSGYDDEGIVAEMKRAGVKRAVLLSSSSAPTGDMTNAVAAYHLRSERALEQSGLGWTFVRPSSFMSNTLQWADAVKNGETIRAAFPEVAIATNDPYDVASVVATAMTTADHEGRALRVTGPEALTPGDRVEILAEVLGRELAYEGQTDDEARAEMEANMPKEYVDAFFSFFVDGTVDETTVLPTVAEVTGREPRSFRQWAELHADAFS